MTDPQHNPIADPVPGDLDQELTQAKRGLSKVTIGLGVVVLALVAFFGGVWTHSAIAGSPDAAAQQPQRPGGGPRFMYPPQGGGQGMRGTVGTVDRVEGNTIYVKMPDGTEVKVTTSDSTKVETSVAGKLSDITPGSSVMVQGQRTEDGVAADTITKRPAA